LLYQNYFLKKFIPIIFLSILFLSQFGYYVFYTIQLQLAKEAAKEQLLKQVPDNLLVKVCLTGNHTIQWEEEGKEFSLNGEMYDVVKIKEENGKQYIFCVNDEREDQVLEGLKKLNATNTGNTPGKHQAAAKMAIQQWAFEPCVPYCFPGISLQDVTKYFDYTASLYNNDTEIISPPPNLIITKQQA